MVKFKYTRKDGSPGYGFGISAENVERLKKGQPIIIDMTEMGGEGEVMIFYGETTGDLIKTVQPFIGKETKIDDRL